MILHMNFRVLLYSHSVFSLREPEDSRKATWPFVECIDGGNYEIDAAVSMENAIWILRDVWLYDSTR